MTKFAKSSCSWFFGENKVSGIELYSLNLLRDMLNIRTGALSAVPRPCADAARWAIDFGGNHLRLPHVLFGYFIRLGITTLATLTITNLRVCPKNQ